MNIEIEERNWRKRSTEPMKTGWDFADHAEQIADFLADLDLVDYDSFVSVHFSDYICQMARAFKINEHPERFSVYDKYDLHSITCGSLDLVEFIDYLSRKEAEGLRRFYA